ncbi:MAG: MFS transporter, partial [Chloroflexia bacterium]|nr:MFS transporter [Chloroflexia bacterium]
LSQPLFGWLSDKAQGRTMLLAAVSVAWIAVFFTMVALAPTWTWLLPVFLLAALGSGLFHPIGTAASSVAVPDHAASATSIFFFSGQVGLAVGPFLAGILVGRFGAIGLLPLTAMAIIPISLLLASARTQTKVELHHKPKADVQHAARTWTLLGVVLIAAFVLLVAVRSSIQAVYQAYLPQLFQGRGWEPALFGLLAGVFMAAGAVGQILNGMLADRHGMRVAIVGPLLLSVPVGLLCLLTPSVAVAFIACAGAGLLIGGQHSVLVVHAQRMLPVQRGFAAGLILGFTFASGAIGTWVAGQLANQVGMQTVMVWATLLGLPAALLALAMPGTPRVARKAAAPASAAD